MLFYYITKYKIIKVSKGGKNMNTDKIYAESIVNEYSAKKTSKVVALKKLDAKAKLPATIFGFSFGIIFTLILGLGMCLAMNVIGQDQTINMISGIIIGIVGIIGVSINYPIYKKILQNGKNKYSYDIITLAKEIVNE